MKNIIYTCVYVCMHVYDCVVIIYIMLLLYISDNNFFTDRDLTMRNFGKYGNNK